MCCTQHGCHPVDGVRGFEMTSKGCKWRKPKVVSAESGAAAARKRFDRRGSIAMMQFGCIRFEREAARMRISRHPAARTASLWPERQTTTTRLARWGSELPMSMRLHLHAKDARSICEMHPVGPLRPRQKKISHTQKSIHNIATSTKPGASGFNHATGPNPSAGAQMDPMRSLAVSEWHGTRTPVCYTEFLRCPIFEKSSVASSLNLWQKV